MEVSCLSTTDAAGRTREELLLCCHFSPLWPIITHTARATTLASTALGGDTALSAAALSALCEPNPGLKDRAVWERGQNSPFSASMSCEIGSDSSQPMCVGVTFVLQWTFKNLDQWEGVCFKPVNHSFSPECANVSTCRTPSHWGDCLGESVFGQRAEFVTSTSNFEQNSPLCFPVMILQIEFFTLFL